MKTGRPEPGLCGANGNDQGITRRFGRSVRSRELVRPLLDLGAEPEHASTAAEVDDGPRHVGVAVLVHADVSRAG